MYDKNTWQFWVFVIISWLLFPITALWLFATHPGRCALITKKLITEKWGDINEKSNFDW